MKNSNGILSTEKNAIEEKLKIVLAEKDYLEEMIKKVISSIKI